MPKHLAAGVFSVLIPFCAIYLAQNRAVAAIWEPTGPNLIPNGGFELALAKWFLSGEKTGAVCDEQVVHSGKRSLRITARGRPGEIRAIGFAKVNPMKKYRVTFAAKSEGLGRDKRLPAEFAGGMAAAVGLSAYCDGRWLKWCPRPEAVALSGTADWKTFSFDVHQLPPAANSIQLHLLLHNGAKGTVWFDDVDLKELDLRRPSLVLATGMAANVFTTDEAARVEAHVANGEVPRELTLRWEIKITAAEASVTGARQVHLGSGQQQTVAIPVPRRVGHYVVTAELLDRAELDRDRLEAAVVPVPARQPCPSLALWAGDCSLARKAGANWTREMAFWRYLEPEPGKYRWELPDANIKRARSAGLKVVLCFAQTPRWASTAPEGHADFGIYPPKCWPDLSRFVEAAVRRFGPDVDAWEIWNEPVIPWGWKGSADDVVTLHRVVHDAIRRVQPHATILGPCICQGTFPLLRLKALQSVLPLGILGYCDGFAIHPYREPFGPEYTFFAEELAELRAFADQRGIRQGLWITEIGWSTSEYPHWPKRKVSEMDQAAYLARSAVTAVAQEVRLFNWHSLCEWDVPDAYEKQFGIVRAGMNGPKPAYVAYAVTAHYLAGARCTGRLSGTGLVCAQDRVSRDKIWDGLRPASTPSVDGYWFERAGKPLLIAWSISGRQETIQLPANDEVQVQDALGSVARLSPSDRHVALKLSELPVYVTGLAGKP